MLIALLYWSLTLLCCSHGILFGGRDGRWAAFLLLAASGLTIPATQPGNAWEETQSALFAVDLLFLAGLYALMLSSRRYWPIWMTGFHLVAVVSHLSTKLAPSFTPQIYWAMETFWAIPANLSLLIGVELDRRARATSRVSPPGHDEGFRRER